MPNESTEEQPLKPLAHDDSAVIKHMEMLQSIISRMAGNSAACKNWAILLVSAILAFIVEGKQFELFWIALIPGIMFYFLDAYYLMLENRFRASFNAGAEKLASGRFYRKDLFDIRGEGNQPALWKKALLSPSTLPVYLTLLLIPIVIQQLAG